ncbi:MAG: hypothetical protein ACR2PL_20350, partial [Dehalococcoidia bacterium]
LLQMLVSQPFREHAINYGEVVSALAPVGLQQVVAGASGNGHLEAYRVLLETLAKTEPAGVAHLQELWQTAPPSTLSTRATFPVLWRADDGALLSFHGILSLWSDYLWYWALDWHPADAKTWEWLKRTAEESVPDVQLISDHDSA